MKFNLDTGILEVSELVKFWPKMTRDDLFNQLKDWQGIVKNNGTASIFQSKKLNSFLFNFKEKFQDYGTESISVIFDRQLLNCTCINLLPCEKDNQINSSSDLAISHFLKRALKFHGISIGNAKLEFQTPWGLIEVLYDIKMSCATVCIAYR